jgi:type IV pilus assembly protein PilW
VDVVKVTDASGTPTEALKHDAGGSNGDNNQLDLSKDYDANAEVMKLVTRAYYIGTTGSGEPALMSMDMEKGAWGGERELIEGIESMQILYGEDIAPANGSADEYRLPANVTDWSRVVSIRVGLLSRTPTETGQDVDGKTYDLLSDSGTVDDYNSPSDKHQRRIFSSTIQVRNLRTD